MQAPTLFKITNRAGYPVIKKTKSGYKVTSEKGKNLSKANLSLEGAKKRLAQVEFFKHKGEKSK